MNTEFEPSPVRQAAATGIDNLIPAFGIHLRKLAKNCRTPESAQWASRTKWKLIADFLYEVYSSATNDCGICDYNYKVSEGCEKCPAADICDIQVQDFLRSVLETRRHALDIEELVGLMDTKEW